MTYIFLLAQVLGFALRSDAQGFENVSTSNGINFGYLNGEYGGGVSFADFNQDGWDDLTFATGYGSVIRFFQNTGGSFTEIFPGINNAEEVKQVLWVDFNNDGLLDFYTTAHNGNRLYRNEGNLTFTDITSQCGFFEPQDDQSFCATWLDFNQDALPDLCVSFRESLLVGQTILYQNVGNDYFVDVTSQAGLANTGNSVLAMTSLDYNNDRWTDIYLAQDWNAGGAMARNNGDGTFTILPQGAGAMLFNNSMSATVGDYNSDQQMDMYITDTYENSLLRNNGDGTFTDEAATMNVIDYYFSWGAVFMDSDNDADVDLHFNTTAGHHAYENPGASMPFINRSCDWGFCYTLPYMVGLACGDMDHDGFTDLASNGSQGSSSALFRNTFNDNHYLAIRLEGTVSNAFAIGAVIDVYAGGKHQRRRVACGEGFSSQNSYVQYFGLGNAAIADTVTVLWPNGLISQSIAVPADQVLILQEEIQVSGCMDPVACNFNSLANEDSGNCEYAEENYNCAGECLADADDDGVCDPLEIAGCTDPLACNYEAAASDDNGTCNYPPDFYSCSGECLSDTDQDGICNELEIAGCQDPDACNFNPQASDPAECFYLEVFDVSGASTSIAGEIHAYSYPYTEQSSYEWLVESPDLITEGQGTQVAQVQWNAPGMRSVKVRETILEGCTGEWSEFLVLVDPVGIKEAGNLQCQIYPNPVYDLLSIDLTIGFNGHAHLDLYNSFGSLLFGTEVSKSKVLIDFSSLPAGVYTLVCVSGDYRASKRLIRE